jgi:hypothetical protein
MSDDARQQHWLETYKSLIALSIEGFKFSLLVNGGAAVAILAYIGNAAAKSTKPYVPNPDMRAPMGLFVAGVLLCGIAMFCAYLTQLRLLNEPQQVSDAGHPHTRFLLLTMVFHLASLFAFGVGALIAVVRF